MRFEDLPESPLKSHSFFALDSIEVVIKLPERGLPIRIHCKIAGSGRPLLLVHGLMTSSYSFRYIVPALATKYHVIVPDLPGAGRSEAPADLSMSPRATAQLLSGLICALQIEPPSIVGNSLGGYQALWFAVLFPDQVRKLIMMHAPGFPQWRLSTLRFVLAFGSGRALTRWLLRRDPEAFVAKNIHYFDRSLMSREEAREYSAIFRDPDRTDIFIRILREGLDPGPMRALAKRLSDIRDGNGMLASTRLLWAREDEVVPSGFGPKYQRLIPSAELVWFDRASHFLQVDDPDNTVREIMLFI